MIKEVQNITMIVNQVMKRKPETFEAEQAQSHTKG